MIQVEAIDCPRLYFKDDVEYAQVYLPFFHRKRSKADKSIHVMIVAKKELEKIQLLFI